MQLNAGQIVGTITGWCSKVTGWVLPIIRVAIAMCLFVVVWRLLQVGPNIQRILALTAPQITIPSATELAWLAACYYAISR